MVYVDYVLSSQAQKTMNLNTIYAPQEIGFLPLVTKAEFHI